MSEVSVIGLPLSAGLVWTTDAPCREEQLKLHAEAGALAVEMQAASLFAFGAARDFPGWSDSRRDERSRPHRRAVR